jgi:hypothetical protein
MQTLLTQQIQHATVAAVLGGTAPSYPLHSAFMRN